MEVVFSNCSIQNLYINGKEDDILKFSPEIKVPSSFIENIFYRKVNPETHKVEKTYILSLKDD